MNFCKLIDITIEEFDEVINRFVNRELVVKNINNQCRRRSLVQICNILLQKFKK